MTLKAAAAAFSVRRRPPTAGGIAGRGERKRPGGRWAVFSTAPAGPTARPASSPRELEERICACRRKTGWGQAGRGCDRLCPLDRLEGAVGAGISRPPRPARQPANSYEWPCPGDLLHMDVSRYARFERPGHALTGDRSQRNRTWMKPQTRVGYDYAHAIVDDHSRLAYVELHPDERAAAVTAFLERALVFFERQGITSKRLLTDNAFGYVKNRTLRELLAARGIKHLTTQPYRPRTNGKVERFHQTMAREWAYGSTTPHRQRNAALPHWLQHYNRHRPHSSLGGKPPISRVHNVCG